MSLSFYYIDVHGTICNLLSGSVTMHSNGCWYDKYGHECHPTSDGIVTGTGGNDVMLPGYVDGDGDKIDGNDAHLSGMVGNDDLIVAGAGNDSVDAGNGNDLVFGGTGADTLSGGAGNDTIYGDSTYVAGSGSKGGSISGCGTKGGGTTGGGKVVGSAVGYNDLIYGGAGNDVLFGEGGNDTLVGGTGNNELYGGTGDDRFVGGAGSDTFYGGAGQDNLDYSASGAGVTVNLNTGVLSGGDAANDHVGSGIDGAYGSNFADSLTGFDQQGTDASDTYTNQFYGNGGNDTISGMGGNDQLYGGNDQDLIYGGSGDDTVSGDAGNDTLYGGAGNDLVYGGTGNDLMYGGDGNDQMDGGAGNDTMFGDAGNDHMYGGDGNDQMYGGDGADTIEGGAGNDSLYAGGSGNDQLFGGNDADSFFGGHAGEMVDGGEGGYDHDTLDLTGAGPLHIVYDPSNPENGTVQFLDPTDHHVTGTMSFKNIEKVIPCFTPGTLIATPRGEVPVESLRTGDRIITRDNGMQEICWMGRRDLTWAELAAAPHLKPVLVRQGALGNGLPEQDMMVSPNHRLLVANDRTALYFDEHEVLVAAKHLISSGVHSIDAAGVSYIHFMCERHEVVLSNGAWTETFQPGDFTLKGMGNAQRSEIFEIFPELTTDAGLENYAAARKTLKRHEAVLLVR
ncbi:MAG: Hint domain-containing protein [Cypionkella sp.]